MQTFGLAFESQRVTPGRLLVDALGNIDLDQNLRVFARQHATKLRNAATVLDTLLQATAVRPRHIAQEAKHIEQVRFSRCIWADDVRPLTERNVSILEVSPVFQFQTANQHHPSSMISSDSIPRSSTIFTATLRYAPASNGSDTVPWKCCSSSSFRWRSTRATPHYAGLRSLSWMSDAPGATRVNRTGTCRTACVPSGSRHTRVYVDVASSPPSVKSSR